MSFKKAQDLQLKLGSGKNGWDNEAKYAYPKKLQNKQKYNLMASKPKGRKKPHWISFKMKLILEIEKLIIITKKHHSHSTNLKSIGNEQFSKSNIIYMFGSRKEF